LRIAEPSLLVLVGASGAGKSSFARRHFRATEVVSSDVCRALAADDENALDANREAFRLLHHIATSRLRLGKLAVIDATNLQPGPRRSWVTMARSHEVPVLALVFDVPLALLEERSLRRTDRRIGIEVIRSHHEQLSVSAPGIEAEGFDEVHVVHPEQIDDLVVERAGARPSGPLDAREAAMRWKRTWEQAWPRKEVEAIAALYAPDVPYRAVPLRAPDMGVDGVRRYLRENFDVEDEIRCRFGEPMVDGDRAVVEWWASWIENSKPLTLAGATVLRFDAEGLVTDHRDYWNSVDERVEPYPGW
jgi:predicted kinase